jgi:hypothetical protein
MLWGLAQFPPAISCFWALVHFPQPFSILRTLTQYPHSRSIFGTLAHFLQSFVILFAPFWISFYRISIIFCRSALVHVIWTGAETTRIVTSVKSIVAGEDRTAQVTFQGKAMYVKLSNSAIWATYPNSSITPIGIRPDFAAVLVGWNRVTEFVEVVESVKFHGAGPLY